MSIKDVFLSCFLGGCLIGAVIGPVQGLCAELAIVGQQLKADVAKKDFAAVAATVNEAFVPYIEAARSPASSVRKRARDSAIAVREILSVRAIAMAEASDFEGRAAVREIIEPSLDEARAAQRQADSELSFMGLSWGLGFGFSFGADDAVDEAEIVNGIVRAKTEKKQRPRALLEFHKYFWANEHTTNVSRGFGPFVAVAATEDKVLSGVGMGLMYGFKAKADEKEGFSIGAGAILDGKVKDLADDFEQNKPPPPGETSVRFKEKARWSGLLFVTRTF